ERVQPRIHGYRYAGAHPPHVDLGLPTQRRIPCRAARGKAEASEGAGARRRLPRAALNAAERGIARMGGRNLPSRGRKRGAPSALTLLRLLSASADGFEVLSLLDRRAQELRGAFGVRLRAALELGRGSADQAARRAVPAAVEA